MRTEAKTEKAANGKDYYKHEDGVDELQEKGGLFDVLGVQLGVWSAGPCECTSSLVPNCAMSTLLPCVSLAQVAVRTGMTTYVWALLFFFSLWVMAIGSAVALHVAKLTSEDPDMEMVAPRVTIFVLMIIRFIFVVGASRVRTQVRTSFHIPGNALADLCFMNYCQCCAIAQMATHAQSYQPGHCGFGAPDTLPGCC
ncbi:TPA: hypothetical protein N0F65_002378 [Lagenidium giganteum]|uniref:Uncharacterized protein n=1 Tax=Lagenidium giganteum TaxID=4803 RepID=A0AAV2YM94_9STRA|nr:TPA: hypothetical protein N0F65_002378 [Lagenidium giganteum]